MTFTVTVQIMRHAIYRFRQIIRIGQKNHAKMIRIHPVESTTLHQQHFFFEQQIQYKLLIIDYRIDFRIHSGKQI